ncbi:MAG: RnfABCDGE type electron transport complex subunit D [Treponema sp.]|nr:RnfABCDGE type electron transport complex subunit D [Treponema sp.]
MPDGSSLSKYKAQVNISRPTSERMWLLCGLSFLAVVQSAIGDAGASVYVALAALVAALLSELFVTYREHGPKKIRDGSAAASAMVLVLLLPNQIHPMYAALGAIFAIVVVKHSFGGLGSNWMNPALGGWLFIRFSWPSTFALVLDTADGYIGETGSVVDLTVRDFLNRTVFTVFGAELPTGYIDIFWLETSGIIADRAVLALFLLVAIMFAFRTGRMWISVVYLAVFTLLVRLVGDLPFEGYLMQGNVVLALLSGGTLVTAFILIAEPSSGAKSIPGNVVMAVLAAVLSVTFRYFGGEFYGGFFAVALVNALTPLLSRLERRALYVPHNEAHFLIEAPSLGKTPLLEAPPSLDPFGEPSGRGPSREVWYE